MDWLTGRCLDCGRQTYRTTAGSYEHADGGNADHPARPAFDAEPTLERRS